MHEGNFKKVESEYNKMKSVSKQQALIIAKLKDRKKAVEEENQVLSEEYAKLKALVNAGAQSPSN
jgi:uncharacterized protein YaaN involved in tellurite resistance